MEILRRMRKRSLLERDRMTSPLLRLKDIEKAYGPITALRNISLDLDHGETISLLGPNGAGKSTLLRIVAGLAAPTRGTLEIQGTAHDRRAIGYLGHATLLYPELTARENLIFAARLHGVPKPARRADQLLEEEDLSPVAQRRAGGFSRGMAQRLAIARARVHKPSLLLLDEPFTGLDVPAISRLSQRLIELRNAGQSWLLVTHEVERAAMLADTALIVLRGQVAERLTGDELTPQNLSEIYAKTLDLQS